MVIPNLQNKQNQNNNENETEEQESGEDLRRMMPIES